MDYKAHRQLPVTCAKPIVGNGVADRLSIVNYKHNKKVKVIQSSRRIDGWWLVVDGLWFMVDG